MWNPVFLVVALPFTIAIPAPVPAQVAARVISTTDNSFNGASDLNSRFAAVPALINDLPSLRLATQQVTNAIANGSLTGDSVSTTIKNLFQAVKPISSPTTIKQAITLANAQFDTSRELASAPQDQNFLENVLGLVFNGLTSSDLNAIIDSYSPDKTSSQHYNNPPVAPGQSFYYKPGNAPFSVQEDVLRSAIYIPASFTYGKKQPILMSPGTATTGTTNFASNIGRLLSETSEYDPVYLNVPGLELADAQVNAEYVAYAIQYLYYLTGNKVKPAVVSWSQGSLNAQWAFKYWPSIPNIVTDHIAISPDYHGTVLAYLLCPGFELGNSIACTPSVIQQEYLSKFVAQLRKNNGDSAYVPTTTVYSAADEIVQPQIGVFASGFLKDARNVGVSNTFLQEACALQPAGTLYTHEGVLYNPVAYALVLDALSHDGPGNFNRVRSACQDIVAPGLSLGDVLVTESVIALAVFNILVYPNKVVDEPPLKGYATY